MSRVLVGMVVLTALLASVPSPAAAQRLGGQRFVPAASEDGVLGTEGADRRAHLFPYISLWLNWSLDPVVVRDGGDEIGALVEHAFALDLAASLNVWEGLEFGLRFPVTLFATGDDLSAQTGLDEVSGAGVGDLELYAAYRFELTYRDFLMVQVPVLIPSSKDDDLLFLGFGVRPTVAYLHGFEVLDLLFNVSTLIRGTEGALDYRGGSELGVRVAIRIGLDETWDTGILTELGFTTPFRDFFSRPGTPLEIRAGIDHWFSRHWRLTGFLGTGLSQGVGAPDVRIGVGLAFGKQPRRPRIEPLPGDRDADGILDADDECPYDPEDMDGYSDEDGCPDEDNDGDGILDAEDECPNEPESLDGITDDDGCPDRVRVEGTLIVTFEPVRFRTGSDEILPQSHAMLDEVAGVLTANPSMEITVEGHTDSIGDDEQNMELSQRRAESVRQYLVDHGVSGGRVRAEGHGETRPVASNATDEGRARNRRVEFHIRR